jgi:hypothetical protein
VKHGFRKLLATFGVVSKGQFVSQDTLHVTKLEFDCQTCGQQKKYSCLPSSSSSEGGISPQVDKRTFFCQQARN